MCQKVAGVLAGMQKCGGGRRSYGARGLRRGREEEEGTVGCGISPGARRACRGSEGRRESPAATKIHGGRRQRRRARFGRRRASRRAWLLEDGEETTACSAGPRVAGDDGTRRNLGRLGFEFSRAEGNRGRERRGLSERGGRWLPLRVLIRVGGRSRRWQSNVDDQRVYWPKVEDDRTEIFLKNPLEISGTSQQDPFP